MPQLVSLSAGEVDKPPSDSINEPSTALMLPHLKALALTSLSTLAFELFTKWDLPSLTHMHVYDLTSNYETIVQFFNIFGSKLLSVAAFVQGGDDIPIQRVLTPCRSLKHLTLEISVGITFGDHLHLPTVERVSLLGLQGSAEADLNVVWWNAVDLYANQLISKASFPGLKTIELVDINQAAMAQDEGYHHWSDTVIPSDRIDWWNEFVQKISAAHIALVDCEDQSLSSMILDQESDKRFSTVQHQSHVEATLLVWIIRLSFHYSWSSGNSKYVELVGCQIKVPMGA